MRASQRATEADSGTPGVGLFDDPAILDFDYRTPPAEYRTSGRR
jgi:hypothetical protein